MLGGDGRGNAHSHVPSPKAVPALEPAKRSFMPLLMMLMVLTLMMIML